MEDNDKSDAKSRIQALVRSAHDNFTLFQSSGDLEQLESAYRLAQEAVDLSKAHNCNLVESFSALGSALQTRYRYKGDRNDLDRAIACHQEVLQHCTEGSEARAEALNNLATALRNRYTITGNNADLDAAATLLEEALQPYPSYGSSRTMSLINLGNILQLRYQATGSIADIVRSVDNQQTALDEMSPQDTFYANCLNNLGFGLYLLFQAKGDPADLTKGIGHLKHALDLRPPGHPARAGTLRNLCQALTQKYYLSSDIVDLNQVIEYNKEALTLNPPGTPQRPLTLTELARAFQTRFDKQGNLADVDTSLSYGQQALSSCPLGDPNRPTTLSVLAAAHSIRFRVHGRLPDISTAIAFYKEAESLEPVGNTSYIGIINNLTSALTARFVFEGDIEDMNNAIQYVQRVLPLPPGHPLLGGLLLTLGHALYTRYLYSRKPSDIDEAIKSASDALKCLPPSHVWYSVALQSLGSTLIVRFEDRNHPADLDASLVALHENLKYRPVGHAGRPETLARLADGYHLRFRRRDAKLEDLDSAVRYREEALDLLDKGHRERAAFLFLLVKSLEEKRKALEGLQLELDTLPHLQERIMSTLKEASQSTIGASSSRLESALFWMRRAISSTHPSAMEACLMMLDALDLTVARGSSLEKRHLQLTSNEVLRWAKQHVTVAATYAIEMGNIETAVEFLERGRTVLFTQFGRYRTPLDRLREVDAELAGQFEDLSRLLESSSLAGSPQQLSDRPFDDHLSRYGRLAAEWQEVIEKIRSVDGFANFLKPTPFAELQMAAEFGPVIIVNISSRGSHAIIVRNDAPSTAINLPAASYDDTKRIPRNLGNRFDNEVTGILRGLWTTIVHPVVEVLQGELGLKKKARIWWCPTGAASALPLHAAGAYRPREPALPDLFVSSYTPTLGALLRARRLDAERLEGTPPSILVVGQPDTPGQNPLEGVRDELARIKEVAPDATYLESSQGTHSAVLSAISQHSWVHLACHGHQNHQQPFRSHFSVYDKPLYLIDLVENALPDNAGLAVLSACHSAAASGEDDVPDEVLHLAAAMQFAGFRSVVGTLWAMMDADGPHVAQELYKKVLGKDGRGKNSTADYTKAAVALSSTVRGLRLKQVGVKRWINFVHFGA